MAQQDTIWRNQKEYVSVDSHVALVAAAKRDLAEKVLSALGEELNAWSLKPNAKAEIVAEIKRVFTESGVEVEGGGDGKV